MTTMQSPPVTSTRKPTYGLIKAKVGSNHVVKIKGVEQQVPVRERRLFAKAKTVAKCLYCEQDWPSMEAMLGAHAAREVMERQAEAHVYALWCEDPIEKDDPKSVCIGLLSDE